MRNKHNRGAALIIVLGVLVLLSLSATVFSTLSAVERSVSRNYLDGIRARLVARSGIEHAVSVLPHVDFTRDRTWMERNGIPSFAALDANGNPEVMLVDGVDVRYTAPMESASYTPKGDHYSLRIVDSNSLLHVNDGVGFGPMHSVSRNLRRMLRVLAEMKGMGANTLDVIVDARPTAGYRTKYQILSVLNNNLSLFNAIKDSVSVHAWQDPNVAEPVPLSEDVLGAYPADIQYLRGNPGVYRFGRNRNSRGQIVQTPLKFYPEANVADDSIKVYGLDELNPGYIEITKRAPVNINAAPKEILVAVLSGLQSFFRVERRQLNPTRAVSNTRILGHLGRAPMDKWLGQKLDFDQMGSDADDIGLLYSTIAIQKPVSLNGPESFTPNNARFLAEEIIACRDKATGPSGFDYSNAPFGGPFRNWAQFNKFCDNLVTVGALVDNRPIYFDRLNGGGLVSSPIQQKIATQAMADTLKANFNPNLHLNELNPDSNLALLVDKTDMIVHSTEFCFHPPGRFEIESLGRIIQEDKLIASARISSAIKLWEAKRVDGQKEFHGGEFRNAGYTGPASNAPTNSNRMLEIGPEPDNGMAPSETRYSGYLSLATQGGLGINKSRNASVSTPNARNHERGEWFHAHYQLDMDGHYHKHGSIYRKECNRVALPEDSAMNFPDKGEGVPGPYDPMWPTPNAHRLCRDFKTPTGGMTVSLAQHAPSDLHIDGGYSERNCGIGYLVMNGIEIERTVTVTTRITRRIRPG